MTYTRRDFSIALLYDIGNKTPTEDTIKWVQAWTQFETSNPPGASYNLLNTTEPNSPGVVSDYNSAGVKNYDTFEHGIQANAKVLRNSLYPTLLIGLTSNIIASPSFSGHSQLINHDLSTWGTGPVYASIVSQMAHLMTDVFPGDATSLPILSPWTDIALAEFNAIRATDNTTGIATSWLAAFKADMHWGPALCHEYTIDNFAYQYFGGGYCIWDHTKHLPSWSKYA